MYEKRGNVPGHVNFEIVCGGFCSHQPQPNIADRGMEGLRTSAINIDDGAITLLVLRLSTLDRCTDTAAAVGRPPRGGRSVGKST